MITVSVSRGTSSVLSATETPIMPGASGGGGGGPVSLPPDSDGWAGDLRGIRCIVLPKSSQSVIVSERLAYILGDNMLRRLSVDDFCGAKGTCPAVWEDDDRPDELVIVGHPVEPGAVPLTEGEAAIRIRRQVVADAGIA